MSINVRFLRRQSDMFLVHHVVHVNKVKRCVQRSRVEDLLVQIHEA